MLLLTCVTSLAASSLCQARLGGAAKEKCETIEKKIIRYLGIDGKISGMKHMRGFEVVAFTYKKEAVQWGWWEIYLNSNHCLRTKSTFSSYVDAFNQMSQECNQGRNGSLGLRVDEGEKEKQESFSHIFLFTTSELTNINHTRVFSWCYLFQRLKFKTFPWRPMLGEEWQTAGLLLTGLTFWASSSPRNIA